MYLTHIKVKNFRSLVDVELAASDYTAIVGPNDSGKSNVLRALNLFFNGNTDVGQPLVFSQDYSQKAPLRKNKAKQIEIELQFQPPKNYTDNDIVIWKKIWREEAVLPYVETMRMAGGEGFSRRSRTEFWVRQIAFEYVPAIRGKEFFATLKRRLHNTLAATIAPRLESASGGFLKNIRMEVANIEKEAIRLLELSTEFSLPSDLGSFFEILDLKTADKHAATPLQNRGDGIQGRHIPVILRFLADQRKINFAKGKPPPETIWGYEEPENNLELAKQIDESKEFFRCSGTIQVLLTTHSPAFYGVAKTEVNAAAIYAIRDEGCTKFQTETTAQALDQSLGLMPFVEPYLASAVKQRDALIRELKQHRANSLHKDRSVLAVEGNTDKLILDKACEIVHGDAPTFEIVAKPGMGGGTNWAIGYALARAVMPEISFKTGVLVDDDDAGRHAFDKLTNSLAALDRAGRVKCFKVGAYKFDDDLKSIFSAGLIIPVTLEELYGQFAWDYAEDRGWLEDRDDVVTLNAAKLKPSMSFCDLVAHRLPDANRQRLLMKRVRGAKKGDLAQFVLEWMDVMGTCPPAIGKIAEALIAYYK